MGCIIIKQRCFDFEAIKSGVWKKLEPEFKDVFVFCEQWLNGEEKFLLQTSGSTGKPKTIEVSRKQMLASAEATQKFFQIKNGCSLLCCLDTQKIAGKMMMVRAMAWDGRVSLVAPSLNPLLQLDDSYFDFVAMVPLQVKASLEDEHSRKVLDRIGVLVMGGAPPSASLVQQVQHIKGKVYQTYGMTETVSHIALANLKEPGPLMYKVLPGVKIAQDQKGNLQIKAPVTLERWIITRDVVEIISDEQFIWKGRSDFVINSGGIKLHPEVIEKEIGNLVEQFFPGRAYIVIGKDHDQLGQVLTLLLEGDGNKDYERLLLASAKEHLPKYHVPKSIIFVPAFILTSTGKIDRINTIKKCT